MCHVEQRAHEFKLITIVLFQHLKKIKIEITVTIS